MKDINGNEVNPTVKELLKGLLHLQQSPGLENKALECSCEIDDLIPCNEDPSRCTMQSSLETNIISFKRGKRK